MDPLEIEANRHECYRSRRDLLHRCMEKIDRALHSTRVAAAQPAGPVRNSSASQLRILFVCAYVPALGMSGGALRMFHVIRGAAKRHRVTVLCYRDTLEELQHVGELEAICERVEVIER